MVDEPKKEEPAPTEVAPEKPKEPMETEEAKPEPASEETVAEAPQGPAKEEKESGGDDEEKAEEKPGEEVKAVENGEAADEVGLIIPLETVLNISRLNTCCCSKPKLTITHQKILIILYKYIHYCRFSTDFLRGKGTQFFAISIFFVI